MIIQGFLKFHDFSMHGTFFFAIFQVFHDSQCLWEPWRIETSLTVQLLKHGYRY